MALGEGEEPNVFQPSAWDDDSSSTGGAAAHGYRSQSVLVAVVLGGLGLFALTGLWALAGRMELLALPSREMARVHSLGRQGLLWCIIPLYGAFLHRANRNARAMVGEEALHFSPESMVWWFFVPVLNLVRPYQAVAQVWRASASEAQTAGQTSGEMMLQLWWGAWLLHSVVGVATIYSVADPSAAGALGAVLCGTDLARTAAGAYLVRALHLRQERRAHEIWG